MSKPNYHLLKGRLLYVYHDGWRYGRVVAVHAGPRIGLRRVRLTGPSYHGITDRFGWRGREYGIEGAVALAPGAGVYFRRKIIPVVEFLTTRI